MNRKIVYCYETKEKFISLSSASKYLNLLDGQSIANCLNNPNRTAAGYHWCTDLSIFDGVELFYSNNKSIKIYCYETKEEFNSVNKAAGLKNILSSYDISKVINKLDRTAGGYHWCTDLSIFDGKNLTRYNKKIIYCYETKEKFGSLEIASNSVGLLATTPIYICLNNSDKTSAGFHWCTDLSVFDNVELFYPEEKVSSYEREIVDYIKSLGVNNIIQSDRKILNGKELDIYLPDYNLAIEFNGDYWHSTEFKEINYHQEKTLSCIKLNIDLIQIFEFQYNENKDIYLNYILDRINGIDRKDLELDKDGNHILQFCNKKYFLEKQDISEPSLFNYEKNKIYDCGKLTFKECYNEPTIN